MNTHEIVVREMKADCRRMVDGYRQPPTNPTRSASHCRQRRAMLNCLSRMSIAICFSP
jgi:hypothetical protein